MLWSARLALVALSLPLAAFDLTQLDQTVPKPQLEDEQNAGPVVTLPKELGMILDERRMVCYIDQRGKRVLGPYEDGYAFRNGSALVLDKDQIFRVIDTTGAVLVDGPEDGVLASNLSDGLVGRSMPGGFGYADAQGKMVLGPYQRVGDFDGNFARVQIEGQPAIIHRNGKVVFGGRFEQWYGGENYAVVGTAGGWMLIDADGFRVLQGSWQQMGRFGDGLVPIIDESGRGQWLDIENKPWPDTTKKWKATGPFAGGIAIFQATNGKWGVIQRSGRMLVNAKYDELYPYVGDRARFRLKEQWGYLNRAGKEVIPARFSGAGDFHGGIAEVISQDQDVVINLSGDVIWPKAAVGR